MFEEEIRRYDKTVADYQELIVAPMGKEQYRERNEVLFSCHSCGIEGNSFTVDNTRELFEQGLGYCPCWQITAGVSGDGRPFRRIRMDAQAS